MDLSEQIRKKFANIPTENASRLDGFGGESASWAIRFKDAYAVGFEVDESIKINETFANVSFYTSKYKIGESEKHLLLLSSSEESLRNEFAGICALFLEMGEEGKKRAELKANPIKWWQNWKNLIGNRNVEKTVHGLLGELLVLYYLKKELLSELKAENWTGPNGKSFDIQSSNMNFEVKSSLIKYNNIVTISGQYQIRPHNELSLMFVKLEEPGTESAGLEVLSIETLIQKLADLGMDYNILNNNVSKLGYKENSQDRKRRFRVLEIRKYPINDDFPYISQESLTNVNKRQHILQISYKVDLTGLEYEQIGLSFI